MNTGIPFFDLKRFGWDQPVTLIKITNFFNNQVLTNGYLQNVPANQNAVAFEGVVQPLSAEKLEVKREEERSWEWIQIHTKSDLKISTNDRILYNGVQYKVMEGFSAYGQYGFYEYHLVKDYGTTSIT